MSDSSPNAANLRDDALRIWRAGVAAVDSERLVHENLRIDGDWLIVGDTGDERAEIDLRQIERIAVVGAGKAGAGMATAVEAVFGPQLMDAKQLVGWLNVPAACV